MSRGEDGADALDHFGGVQAQPQGDGVVNHGEGEKRGAAGFTDKGQHGHFVGGGAGARDGEERADGEINRHQENDGKPRVDAGEGGFVAVMVESAYHDA